MNEMSSDFLAGGESHALGSPEISRLHGSKTGLGKHFANDSVQSLYPS